MYDLAMYINNVSIGSENNYLELLKINPRMTEYEMKIALSPAFIMYMEIIYCPISSCIYIAQSIKKLKTHISMKNVNVIVISQVVLRLFYAKVLTLRTF